MKKGARKMKAKRPNPVASFDWSRMLITITPEGEKPFGVWMPRCGWEAICEFARSPGWSMPKAFAQELFSYARCLRENLDVRRQYLSDPVYHALCDLEERERHHEIHNDMGVGS